MPSISEGLPVSERNACQCHLAYLVLLEREATGTAPPRTSFYTSTSLVARYIHRNIYASKYDLAKLRNRGYTSNREAKSHYNNVKGLGQGQVLFVRNRKGLSIRSRSVIVVISPLRLPVSPSFRHFLRDVLRKPKLMSYQD